MSDIFQPLTFTITLPNPRETIILKPFGDIHRDDEHCAVDLWQAWIRECKKQHTPNTYYLGLGDYNDFAAWSDQMKIRGAKLHESTLARISRGAQKDVEALANELKFMKGHVVAALGGNHDFYLDKLKMLGSQYFAELMDTSFAGTLSYIRIHVRFKGTSKRQKIDIVAAHGKAGGKLEGNSINQVEDLKLIFPMADIYIMGHDHKKGVWPTSTLYMESTKEGLTMKQKQQYLCRSGSFLKGFVPGESSYLVRALKKPSILGGIELRIFFQRSRSGGADTLTPVLKGIA